MSLVLRYERWQAAGTAALMAGGQLAGPLIAVGLKLVTDAAVNREPSAAFRGAITLTALVGAWSSMSWAAFALRMGFRERCQLVVEKEIGRLTADIHTLEHHERPDYLDRMTLLRQNRWRLAAVPDAVVINTAHLLRFVLTVALLARVHPLLLLLPLCAAPSIAVGVIVARREHELDQAVASVFRMEGYFVYSSHDASVAKELRVFGLKGEFLRRFDELEARLEQKFRSQTIWSAWATATGWVFFGAAFIAALIFVAHEAIRGSASAGDIVLALTLASSVNGQATGLVQLAGWMVGCVRATDQYTWLTQFSDAQGRIAHPQLPQSLPASVRDGITFNDVSFRYPGTDVEVLKNVNVHIPAGAVVAIVGDNGAGKTTLVKLMCRFYDPTSGGISVDGVRLDSVDVDDWRAGLAGGFQDSARFEFLASEVVGIGDLPRISDRGAINDALVRAEAMDVIAGLPSGLETQLGRSFDDGAQLSDGQWQKLALARAMMRDHPRLLVLDEPTAALDAETEHALFDRYAAASKSADITLFVSHRFSTVRMADLIIVIERGRVTESGSHHELMRRGQTYAELYELQARAYR